MGLEFFVTSALQRGNSVVNCGFVLGIFVNRRSNLFTYAALGFATARRAERQKNSDDYKRIEKLHPVDIIGDDSYTAVAVEAIWKRRVEMRARGDT